MKFDVSNEIQSLDIRTEKQKSSISWRFQLVLGMVNGSGMSQEMQSIQGYRIQGCAIRSSRKSSGGRFRKAHSCDVTNLLQLGWEWPRICCSLAPITEDISLQRNNWANQFEFQQHRLWTGRPLARRETSTNFNDRDRNRIPEVTGIASNGNGLCIAFWCEWLLFNTSIQTRRALFGHLGRERVKCIGIS